MVKFCEMSEPDYPTVGFNLNNEISISKPYLNGKIFVKRFFANSLNGINIARNDNSLIFYNQYFGASTRHNNGGFEAIVSPIGSWLANDTVYCIIIQLVRAAITQ